LQDREQLIALPRETRIGTRRNLDAVIAGGAALDRPAAQVGVEVAVAAATCLGIADHFIDALYLDRRVAFDQRLDALRGVRGSRRELDQCVAA
jgi:hypothetical protein